MGLNIKNAETERLIRELALELHTSLTGAVEDAVRARLAEVRRGDDAQREAAAEARLAEGKALLAEIRVRLGEGVTRESLDEELYDERGLFR